MVKDKVCLLSVTYNDSPNNNSYYYFPNNEEYKLYDKVIVPRGDDNAIGMIVRIEYFDKKTPPFDLKNIRTIVKVLKDGDDPLKYLSQHYNYDANY